MAQPQPKRKYIPDKCNPPCEMGNSIVVSLCFVATFTKSKESVPNVGHNLCFYFSATKTNSLRMPFLAWMTRCIGPSVGLNMKLLTVLSTFRTHALLSDLVETYVVQKLSGNRLHASLSILSLRPHEPVEITISCSESMLISIIFLLCVIVSFESAMCVFFSSESNLLAVPKSSLLLSHSSAVGGMQGESGRVRTRFRENSLCSWRSEEWASVCDLIRRLHQTSHKCHCKWLWELWTH